ncbi:unnamed protein product [Vitrella brassicaformis CCMP3155]|uniref:SOUL heme-binding protein n=1 Tax=Vitrella brassicaformis (strain CCMP3155) TaxID=1169540 RepID=A0A0G4H883_VITBC|nr:unnamed protein product [Vitrella brassicaformis CCMP3155]|eukprot:CEM40117.1 unnamed protein product [Vitrella brassicaformis CCMP3155]
MMVIGWILVVLSIFRAASCSEIGSADLPSSGSRVASLRPQLQELLSRSTPRDKKVSLAETLIDELRNDPAASARIIEEVIDVLDEPDVKGLLSMVKFALSEYRSNLRSLRRLLVDIILPEIQRDGDEGEQDDLALLKDGLKLIARVLPEAKSARALESEARRRMRRTSPKEMLTRTPSGLETPKYLVIKRTRRYEIRQYLPYSVCETAMDDEPYRTAIDPARRRVQNPKRYSAFYRLANYLFGGNRRKESMAMTTPVLMDFTEPRPSPFRRALNAIGVGGRRVRMSFVMPSKYWEREGGSKTPPRPEGWGVRVRYVEPQVMAVAYFGGISNKAKVDAARDKLLLGLAKDGIDVEDPESYTLLQYNDPFTAPWMRRNEVAVKVSWPPSTRSFLKK